MTQNMTVRALDIDASVRSAFKNHRCAGGVPGPVAAFPDFPDMTGLWQEAGLTLVRSYDWVSRLDTRNNPESLFPDWDADPTDPRSYNFATTDEWVESVHRIGADVMFTIASSIPRNKLPVLDNVKYGVVVEHIVRHYATGWANGPVRPIRMFEFGDQPDLGPLHFDGPAQAFYDMYEAFCAAVARVDASIVVGGPSLAFPLNPAADYREGFLAFVRERSLRLDFFSYLWFTDPTRDPLDFRFVARELRSLLDAHGFTDTRLLMSYWNYLAIPGHSALSDEKAAFQAAAAIYLQDSAVDDAFFFRADSGADPHYGFIDPTGICGEDGFDERAVAFVLIGQTLTGERLKVTGSDESGFACMASIDGDIIRVLIANFVAPGWALEKRESDEFRFRIPIGPIRIELGYQLPPQRAGLASAGVEVAQVRLSNAEWSGRTVEIGQRTLLEERQTIGESVISASGVLELDVETGPLSVVLLEIVVL